jgi:hypothetical protein
MVRFFLITLLVLISGPAYAEWVKVAENKQAGMTVYVDPDTIRRKEDVVKMWDLYDFKTVQTKVGDSFLSVRSQTQYDCAEERTRILACTWFLGNMGNSKPVLSNSDEQKWKPVEPESVRRTLWKVACIKK